MATSKSPGHLSSPGHVVRADKGCKQNKMNQCFLKQSTHLWITQGLSITTKALSKGKGESWEESGKLHEGKWTCCFSWFGI